MNLSVPYSWLKEYINVKDSPQNIADKLTAHSMSVERVSEIDGETVLDIEMTTNRPDCISVVGIAREVAAIYDKKFVYQAPIIKDRNKSKQSLIDIKVDLKDKNICAKYQAVVLGNMTVNSSPKFISQRLKAAGMQPINNIVDITNYVMLELGQPMHAFDYDKLFRIKKDTREQIKIVVRNAEEKEKVQAINNSMYILDKNDCVITDSKKTIAIAGVSGCLDSAVSNTTKTILLEVANFNSVAIRKTSRRLNLFTDAQIRFEKKLPPELTDLAISRAIELYQKYCDAKLLSPLVSINSKHQFFTYNQPEIVVYFNNIERIIGEHLENKRVIDILKNLGFKILDSNESLIRLMVPWWRVDDITSEIDLIEEIVRIYGLGRIKSVMPSGAISERIVDNVGVLINRLRNFLVDYGLTEIYNTTMVSDKILTWLSGNKLVKIANPLNDDLTVMRSSLLPSMLQIIAKNQEAKDEFLLFEIGKVYAKNIKSGGLPTEKCRLAIGLMSAKNDQGFYRLKGVAELLLHCLRISDCKYSIFNNTSDCYQLFNQNRAAFVISSGQIIGCVGEASPAALAHFGIKKKTWLMELEVESLSGLKTDVISYQELPKFPSVKRDLAVVISKKLSYDNLLIAIQSFNSLISTVECFDVYEGEAIGTDKRSIAWHILYTSDKRTLESREVDAIHKKLSDMLIKKFNAVIR